MAILARELGFKGILLPEQNAKEAAIVMTSMYMVSKTFYKLSTFLMQQKPLVRLKLIHEKSFLTISAIPNMTLRMLKDRKILNEQWRLLLQEDTTILIGPPGAGKTMLAKDFHPYYLQ